MNRLLYFTGYRVVAQEWSGSELKNSVFFEPDTQGFDLFKSYLQTINREPIRLLVDLIEEEFRQASIPFVRGADRKAVIDRNLEKYFRNTSFRQAFSQSVEKKKKRKEENLIFTGITNPELLEPWLKVIEECKVPLAGIISLPIISERLVSQLDNKNKCVILVSQQVPSNLRQTVFVNGKLVLSRLVPIASFYQGKYAEDVIRDIDSTQRYLVSQRIIERSEVVSVHILSNSRHFDKLTIACNESSYFDFEIHNINKLLEDRKIDLYDEQDFSSTLFCYESTKIRNINHYASNDHLKYLKHYKFGLGLKIVGIMLFAVGLGLGVTNAIQGYLYQDRIGEMGDLEKEYQLQNKRLTDKIKTLPATTKDMKKAVDLAEFIKKNYKQTPKKLLEDVSNDLSLFADLRATGVKWFIADTDDRDLYSDVIWGGSIKRRIKKALRKKTKFKGYYEIVMLEGEFAKFDGNYRYALSVLSDFESLLKESGKYDEIQVINKPLNIGGEATLSGTALEKKEREVLDATFTIKIIKKVPLDA